MIDRDAMWLLAFGRCCVFIFLLGMTPTIAVGDPVDLPYTLDLSSPFRARSDWRLVIARGSDNDPSGTHVGRPDHPVRGIHLCFERGSEENCPPMGVVNQPGLYVNEVTRVAIVQFNARSLLLVTTAGAVSEFGFSSGITTWVWTYREATDHFDLVFSNGTGVTNNQETRLLENGPLAGDIVVALNPPLGSPPPYRYTITVYRRSGSGSYKHILHYVARTREGDGNPLAVIDAEMPEIENRLHVWRVGQPFPKPKTMPPDCATVEMRHGVEWCTR
jgi:hypothetical protein